MPSKKPSATKPPDDTVFFVDRSLGEEPIGSRLKAAGQTVIIHDDLFDEKTPDEVWLREAGKNNWVVFTKDKRIRRHPLEMNALRSSGARVFVLTAGNLTGNQIADAFVNALPKIRGILKSTHGPFLRRISGSGKITSG